MARISDTNTYTRDENLQSGDFFIGTDIGDSNATKSYTLEDLRTFIVNGLGASIPQLIAKQFAPVVSQDGTSIEKSLYRIIDDVRVAGFNILSTGANVELGVDFDGTAYIQIIDLNDNSFLFNYRLTSLVGQVWTASIAGVEYTGQISAFQPPNFIANNTDPSSTRYAGNSTHYVFSSTISRTDGMPITGLGQSTVVDSLRVGAIQRIKSFVVGDVQFTNDIDVDGNTTTNTLTVETTSTFLGDANFRTNVDIDGNLNVDGSGQFDMGLGVGESPNNLNITPTDDGVRFDGDGDLTIMNNTTFTNPVTVDCDTTNTEQVEILCDSIRVTDNDGDRVTLDTDGLTFTNPDSQRANRQVVPNGRAGTNEGTLESLQFTIPGPNGASQFYEVVSGSNAIAELLPGVGETLQGPAMDIVTGRFVVATEDDSSAIYVSTVLDGTENFNPAVAISAGETSGTLTVAADRTILGDAFDARGTNEIFFVESTNNDPFTSGEAVSGNVYELISYNRGSGVFRFGLLGGGIFTIGTQNIRFPNISRESHDELLTYDTTDGSIHYDTIDLRARANGANATGTAQDGVVPVGSPLRSLEFRNGSGNEGITWNNGNMVVDFAGIAGAEPTALRLTDANVLARALTDVDHILILDNIPVEMPDPTVTLPTTTAVGREVKISNISRYETMDTNVNEEDLRASSVWQIEPASGTRIMGLPLNEHLVLDTFRANITLTWSGIASIGWVLTGTE